MLSRLQYLLLEVSSPGSICGTPWRGSTGGTTHLSSLHLTMAVGLSSRKRLRNKRKLVPFLLRQIEEGTKIRVDIFKFMKEIQETSDNSGPEGRLI